MHACGTNTHAVKQDRLVNAPGLMVVLPSVGARSVLVVDVKDEVSKADEGHDGFSSRHNAAGALNR